MLADRLSVPDIILKSQFFDSMGSGGLTSEQRLMLAILADAINIVYDGYRRGVVRDRGAFAEARNWIFQPGGRWPMAFEQVCDGLGINPSALRARISAMVSGAVQARSAPLHLRLKEASRQQSLSVNRARRRRGRRMHRGLV